LTEKNKGGRPRKTLEQVNERVTPIYESKGCRDFADVIMCEMSEGASLTEIKVILGLSNDTYDRFMEEYPEFKDAIKNGVQASESWWLRQGRVNLLDPYQGAKFNSTLWYMNMKNRFGWRDKQEVEHSGNAENPVVLINAGINPYSK
jgi:hypothetical protein